MMPSTTGSSAQAQAILRAGCIFRIAVEIQITSGIIIKLH